MSTVRQFIWERLFESTNYILEVVNLDNMHLLNTPHKRHRTNTSGLVSPLKSQTATFLEIACCILVSWWEPQWIFLSRESTMSTITVNQRETQTGHQIGHCSMPRRCPRGARWHQRWRCCVTWTSHRVRAEAFSRWNFLRIICPWCDPTLCVTSTG